MEYIVNNSDQNLTRTTYILPARITSSPVTCMRANSLQTKICSGLKRGGGGLQESIASFSFSVSCE